MWQADTAFPSGSFGFSYGIEGVSIRHPRLDRKAFQALLEAILQHRWATFDRIALLRAHQAAGDMEAIAAIDRDVEVTTFGDTMREGSRRNGASFLAAHARSGSGVAKSLMTSIRVKQCLGHLAVMHGVVWRDLGLDSQLAQITSCYLTLSGACAAAVRLSMIGALEAQAALRGCLQLVDGLITYPEGELDLASFTPFIEIVQAKQARADLRLFAN